MTQSSWPWDAAGQGLTESKWAEMMRNTLRDGVVSGFLNELIVTADSSAMNVKVDTGAALQQGFYFKNDALVTLTIAAANASLPRIDTIILRLDSGANSIVLAVKQGTPNASPTPPALTTQAVSASFVYEKAIADVLVPAAAGVIASGNVTDRRIFASSFIPANSITHLQVATANKDGVAATPSMRTLGTGGQQAAAGNHSHASNALDAGDSDDDVSYHVAYLLDISTRFPVINRGSNGKMTSAQVKAGTTGNPVVGSITPTYAPSGVITSFQVIWGSKQISYTVQRDSLGRVTGTAVPVVANYP